MKWTQQYQWVTAWGRTRNLTISRSTGVTGKCLRCNRTTQVRHVRVLNRLLTYPVYVNICEDWASCTDVTLFREATKT